MLRHRRQQKKFATRQVLRIILPLALMVKEKRMTLSEIFDSGVGKFAPVEKIIALLRNDFCLIGGLALNCYVEPVFTADIDFAISAGNVADLQARLTTEQINYQKNNYDLSIFLVNSRLRVHVTFDERYAQFPARAETRQLFDAITLPVATLDDLIAGKTWAYNDPQRQYIKREKDRLDLLRILEAYPDKRALLPPTIIAEYERAKK